MCFDKRMVSFLPMIFMMCLIFLFSNQSSTDSAGLSYRFSSIIVRSADEIQGANWDEAQVEEVIGSIHQTVRKIAHVVEYFLLTLTVLFPFCVCGLKKYFPMSVAVICVLYAALDECHQIFIAGRGPSVRDVGIDCIGIVIGLALYYVVRTVRRVRRA
ncbi:MAG: VanZ family protein [Lachnospiraceae bacterium]|nr:VanZ family protein [Lachnospiraceae bacterium]